MPIRLSEALRVSHEDFIATGAFDPFVGFDSLFYIDPRLLDISGVKEVTLSHGRLTKYFAEVLRILDACQAHGDVFWRRAAQLLQFEELPSIGLGYSQKGTGGKAIGPGLAEQLLVTAHAIVKAGIKDPVIFELVGLFEEGIGADRISDMCGAIILPDLVEFSAIVARKLKIGTCSVAFDEGTHELPCVNGKHFILVPSEILTPLPVAHFWSDIDLVCSHNDELRRRVNKTVGVTWRDATRRISKGELKSILLRDPDLLRDLITQYKSKPVSQYDFKNDPAGELIWYDAARDFARRFPLDLTKFGTLDATNVVAVVRGICEHFSSLVENNGLFRLFYDDSRQLKHERAAQLLFYGIADAYCAANNLDLNRECDAGRGHVDFKVSKGYAARVNVEVKYSTNKQLFSGYVRQLPTYDRAEKTFYSVYLVIKTGRSEGVIRRLARQRNAEVTAGRRAPDVIIVDGTYQSSASHT